MHSTGQQRVPVPALPDWDALEASGWASLESHPLYDSIRALARRQPAAMRASQTLLGSRLQPFAGYRAFARRAWPELVAVYAEQLARSSRAGSEHDEVHGVGGGLVRRHNQLPCSRPTVEARVRRASETVPKSAPVLVAGDDDLVSVGLARAGFTDVTAIDIDPIVVRAIRAIADEEGLAITTQVHDLTHAPPPELMRKWDLVLLDPPCNFPGLSLFLTAAMGMSLPGSPVRVLLATHLMALFAEGQPRLTARLEDLHLEVTNVTLAFSVYPLTSASVAAQRASLAVFSALSFETALWRREAAVRYFVSDLLELVRHSP